ncbi:MAG: hypothetical protein M0Z87_10765 [Actinomycetota bacterium]|nr:hypothetical protein [Actinomycetota bacterium]
MPAEERLRVIDFGYVSPLRSQTLWHAVAMGVSDGAAPPTLSFARPTAPYVGIGYHRSLQEVDTDVCAAKGLPVYRRMVGGGPVYLDQNQLFFQITIPARQVVGVRSAALRKLLGPAVAAFRAAGIDAQLDAATEIVVGERKVCGHGAGQIEEAVTVVGNCIESFDHEEAVSTLRLPDDRMRSDVLAAMRSYVGPPEGTPAIDSTSFTHAAAGAYEKALGLTASPGQLTDAELAHLDRLDDIFVSPRWISSGDAEAADEPAEVAAPDIRRYEPARRDAVDGGCRQVKIRGGVYVFRAATEAAVARGTVVGGRIRHAKLRLRGSNALQPDLEEGELQNLLGVLEAKLEGLGLGEAADVLRSVGAGGSEWRVASTLADTLDLVDRTGMEAGR